MGMPTINSGMLSVMGNAGTPTSYVGNVNLSKNYIFIYSNELEICLNSC
jgi:hypothetical protein